MAKQQVKETEVKQKKRPCPLTIDQINVLDHNDIEKLKRFISDRGKIYLVVIQVYQLKNSALLSMQSCT